MASLIPICATFCSTRRNRYGSTNISDDDDRKKASEEIKKRVKEKDKAIEFMERKSFGQQLGGFAPEIIADLLSNIPGVGPLVGTLFKNVCKAIIGQF